MEGEQGDTTNKQEEQRSRQGHPSRRRKPGCFCGACFISGDETPPRMTEDEVKLKDLQQELFDLRRAKRSLVEKKRVVKARIVILKEDMKNEEQEDNQREGMQIKAFASLSEALKFMSERK